MTEFIIDLSGFIWYIGSKGGAFSAEQIIAPFRVKGAERHLL